MRARALALVLVVSCGTLTDPRVLEKQAHPALIYVALDAIRRWRATSATRDGVPVDAICYVEFIYVLR